MLKGVKGFLLVIGAVLALSSAVCYATCDYSESQIFNNCGNTNNNQDNNSYGGGDPASQISYATIAYTLVTDSSNGSTSGGSQDFSG